VEGDLGEVVFRHLVGEILDERFGLAEAVERLDEINTGEVTH
jgi:hypothetical protein